MYNGFYLFLPKKSIWDFVLLYLGLSSYYLKCHSERLSNHKCGSTFVNNPAIFQLFLTNFKNIRIFVCLLQAIASISVDFYSPWTLQYYCLCPF